MNPIERFILNLVAATGKYVRKEQTDIYLEKLSRWNLRDDQWARACSLLIDRGLDGMPQLPEIYAVLKKVTAATTVEQTAAFRTWKDQDGRCVAQRCGTRDLHPGPQTLNLWRLESVPVEVGRQAFIEGYNRAGGKPELLQAILRAVGVRQPAPETPPPEEPEYVPDPVEEEIPF